MNKIMQTIRDRRSVRAFTDEPVDGEQIEAILEAGRWAPSGLNNQPWRYIVITDSAVRQAVAEKTKYRKVMEQAVLQIAVFLDRDGSYHREKDIQAIGATLQNMLLAIHSFGLGAVWMGEILNRREEVEEILEVPESFELMAVLAVGHPRKVPADSKRKPLEDLIYKRV
jgi:nitroreductase